MEIKTFCASPINPTKKEHLSLMLNKKDIEFVYDNLLKLKKEYSIKIGTLTVIPHCLLSNKHRNIKELINSCSAGSTSLTISHDYTVKPCPELEINIGNLASESLSKLWDKTTLWREKFYDINCNNCCLYSICDEGCRSLDLFLKKEGIDNEKRRLKNIPTTKKDFNLDTTYYVPDIMYRLEGDDYLITEGSKIIFGNKELLTFIIKLNELGNFKPVELINRLGDEVKGLLNYLYYNDFLVKR